MTRRAQISKAATPTLTILIVSWNDWAKLRACLTSIYGDSVLGSEIVIIDNHFDRRYCPTHTQDVSRSETSRKCRQYRAYLAARHLTEMADAL